MVLVLVDESCGNYGLLRGRSDIFVATLEHLKQKPHAQIGMEVAGLTPLADHASALAHYHKCRPLRLLKYGQIACACGCLEHRHTHLRFPSMLSRLQMGWSQPRYSSELA